MSMADWYVAANRITPVYADFELCLVADTGESPLRSVSSTSRGGLTTVPNLLREESQAFKSKTVAGRYLGTDRRSRVFYDALKNWLSSCRKAGVDGTHSLCATTKSGTDLSGPYSSPLPTRCLDVSGGPARLVETAGQHGEYIVLSHRWHANTSSCNTTASNYHGRLSGDIGQLTAVFEDALTVARGFGIRYVWIDSVCIIQSGDGGRDWRAEAAKMGQYYSRAAFTISAVNGAEDHGFLTMVPPRMESIVQLPFFNKGQPAGHLYAYRRPQRAENLFSVQVDRSELMSRGWVYQEYMLSRRIIYFTESETFVQCASSNPQQIPGSQVLHGSMVRDRGWASGRGFDLGDFNLRLHQNFNKELDLENIKPSLLSRPPYQVWYNIVMGYSSTSLTFPAKDHLLAISGVAGEFLQLLARWDKGKNGQAEVLSSHLSGLWRNDIHHGLLWRSLAPQAVSCDCLAPSWSWLALRSAVEWRKRAIRNENALEIAETPRSHPSSVQVPGSPGEPSVLAMTKSLRVRGRLLEVLIKGPDVVLSEGGNKVVQRFHTRRAREMTGDVHRAPDSDKLMRKLTREARRAGSDEGTYYAVFSSADPDDVAGWASMDESQYFAAPGNASSFVGPVLACHVATRRLVKRSVSNSTKTTYGHTVRSYNDRIGPSWTPIVYDVLFLSPVGSRAADESSCDRYRRVGVGSIFDEKLTEIFFGQEKQEFELV